jgi:hypothetical protein
MPIPPVLTIRPAHLALSRLCHPLAQRKKHFDRFTLEQIAGDLWTTGRRRFDRQRFPSQHDDQ